MTYWKKTGINTCLLRIVENVDNYLNHLQKFLVRIQQIQKNCPLLTQKHRLNLLEILLKIRSFKEKVHYQKQYKYCQNQCYRYYYQILNSKFNIKQHSLLVTFAVSRKLWSIRMHSTEKNMSHVPKQIMECIQKNYHKPDPS